MKVLYLINHAGKAGTEKYVLNLVEYHMKPNTMAAANSSVKSTNKLFDSVLDKKALIYIAMSDYSGKTESKINERFLFERLEIYNEYMSRPYVTGKDLIACGLKPDENFSEILSYAHMLRLSGVAKDTALKQTIAYIKEKKM